MKKQSLSDLAKSILVIDDMKLNFLVVKKSLEPYPNLQIHFVQDPREAFNYLNANKIDLILLDFEMPHISGAELCEKIKSEPRFESIPILFFTASSAQDSIELAFKKGADDYINKPIFTPELFARIQRIFDNQCLKQELQHKLDEQVSLTRLLSHDLNNYICILKTYSSLLLKNRSALSEIELKSVSKIAKTSERMEELVLNIRSIQGINDQKIKFENQKSKIHLILNESISNFQEKLNSKNIQIKFNTADEDSENQIFVWAEKTSLLNSVFGNVLSNAIKFSEKGQSIDINTELQGDHFLVFIKDYGIGMDEKLLSNVFSKTEKTSRPGTDNESGTGFGMPLVKSFMQQYGGDIELISSPKVGNSNHHGTTVKLTFKRAA